MAIEASPRLERALDQIANGVFSPDEPGLFQHLVRRLYDHDYFLVTCDFDAYYDTQRGIDADYRDTANWTRRTILNTARVGWFSSDRTIRGYARDVWNVNPLEHD